MLKKIAILAAVILISMPVFVAACEPGQGRPTAEERLSRMQKHLDLTDDQVSQIREIHRSGGNRADVAAVLTEEQLSKVKEHRRHLKQRRRDSEEDSSTDIDPS